jgi:hypothetical protein
MVTVAGDFGILDLNAGVFSPLGNTNLRVAGLSVLNGNLYAMGFGGGTLYLVDPSSGKLTSVGTSGLQFFAFGSTLNTLYAMDFHGVLYSISPTSGQATFCCDPTSYDGTLSANSSTLYFANGNSSSIQVINLASNTATYLGNAGYLIGPMVMVNGTLYGGENLPATSVTTINTKTGVASAGFNVTGTGHSALDPTGQFAGLAPLISLSSPSTYTYYFPHLGLGNGYQSVLTYVNYSTQSVSCQTTFLDDSGGPLAVPFGDLGIVSSRTDNLAPGAAIHVQTQVANSASALSGWAKGTCTGPLKASLLYRFYSGSTPQGEASVNASTSPATEFVTFAQTQTGLAYANPSALAAMVTVTAMNSTGMRIGSTSFTLQPGAHGAANVATLLSTGSFTGSVQITSTVPIVSLSLNAEAFPVFSSLPAGDLPAGTPLSSAQP